jgi:hypothetical protein
VVSAPKLRRFGCAIRKGDKNRKAERTISSLFVTQPALVFYDEGAVGVGADWRCVVIFRAQPDQQAAPAILDASIREDR